MNGEGSGTPRPVGMFRVYADLPCSPLLSRLFVENDKVWDLRTEATWGLFQGKMVRGKGYGRVATGVGAQSCGGASGTCVPGCRVLWEAEGTGHQLWSQNGGQFGKKR